VERTKVIFDRNIVDRRKGEKERNGMKNLRFHKQRKLAFYTFSDTSGCRYYPHMLLDISVSAM